MRPVKHIEIDLAETAQKLRMAHNTISKWLDKCPVTKHDLRALRDAKIVSETLGARHTKLTDEWLLAKQS